MLQFTPMNRRRFSSLSAAMLAGSCMGLHATAYALSLNDITNAQASQGLKLALEKGAVAAVKLLGRPNGFPVTTRSVLRCRTFWTRSPNCCVAWARVPASMH